MLITPEQTPIAAPEVKEPEEEDFPILLVALFAAAALVVIILLLNRRRKRPALSEGTVRLEAGTEPKLLGDGEEDEK